MLMHGEWTTLSDLSCGVSEASPHLFFSPHLLISSSPLLTSSPLLLISASPHLLISSPPHLLISSSPHLVISSSPHLLWCIQGINHLASENLAVEPGQQWTPIATDEVLPLATFALCATHILQSKHGRAREVYESCMAAVDSTWAALRALQARGVGLPPGAERWMKSMEDI